VTLDLRHTVRDAVMDVLIRYATGIDGRDWEAFRSCFTENCRLDYGDIGHWDNLDDVTTWMADTHDPLGPTLHRITNVVLSEEEGRIRARSAVPAATEFHPPMALPGTVPESAGPG
jgi:3-phenylpropionate/cinnamic acid dioxygenase small subunit